MPILESILIKIGISGVQIGYKYRKNILQRILYGVFKKNKKIRISLSALLRIKNEDKYLLIRNKLRPELFGPIGGSLKYYSQAKTFLDKLEFEADNFSKYVDSSKLKRDLRGFIPAKNLFKFIAWFETRIEREENCLHRELKEELLEIKEDKIIQRLNTPEFSLIRQINERPHKIAGKTFLQFRIIRIDEFSDDYANESKIIEQFIEAEKNNSDLIWVTSDEIKQGRDLNGNHIGSHCIYLLSEKKELQEDRPWTLKK